MTAPAPNAEQLERIFEAAMHVPDHGKLHPYHFVVMENDGLNKLETLLKAAVVEFDPWGRKIDESRKPSTSSTYGYWRGSQNRSNYR